MAVNTTTYVRSSSRTSAYLDWLQMLTGAALILFMWSHMILVASVILGAGVMSTQQLMAIKFQKPEALARYNGGLILQDTDGDGRLDPQKDRIIGGVIGKAPNGAKGQELKSLDVHGAIDLSRPATAFHAKFGGIFGGATMLLQFTTGDKRGKYRPTLALLSNPDDINSSDGSLYTFTIVAK